MLAIQKSRSIAVSLCFLVVMVVSSQYAVAAGNSSKHSNASQDRDYFAVLPAVAAPGQFIQFNWRVSGGPSFVMSPGVGDDGPMLLPAASSAIQVAPMVTTVFSGEAVNFGGLQAGTPMNTVVSVIPIGLAAASTSVAAGQPVTLHFTGPNNGSKFFLVTLPENSTTPLVPDSCGGATCTGSYVTSALGASRTYMVGATGPYKGEAYSQRVAVAVQGGMSMSCSASPATPAPGQPVTIRWTAVNAQSVRIDQGVGEVVPATAGRVTVQPTQTTTYTCTAADRFGDHLSSRPRWSSAPATLPTSTTSSTCSRKTARSITTSGTSHTIASISTRFPGRS